jgi:uncharacterized protein YcbK (DUF882 family)
VTGVRDLETASAHVGDGARVSAHFSAVELRCPHCRELFIRPALLQVLERIRSKIGRPLPIASAYRCPVHNRRVGGAVNSQHVYGAAADIPLGLVAPATAESAGAVGIGTQGAWVRHVDVRDGAPARWVY